MKLYQIVYSVVVPAKDEDQAKWIAEFDLGLATDKHETYIVEQEELSVSYYGESE